MRISFGDKLLVVVSLGLPSSLSSCSSGTARPTYTLADLDGQTPRYVAFDSTIPVEAATMYHRSFTLENWGDGGKLSHFVYLRPSQFFRTAVIHRQGSVSKLEYHLDPSIGKFVVEEKDGH